MCVCLWMMVGVLRMGRCDMEDPSKRKKKKKNKAPKKRKARGKKKSKKPTVRIISHLSE